MTGTLQREKILRRPTRPVEVQSEKTISELLSDMSLTGFQGRKLGEAADVWTAMLKKREIVIWMGLAGAMVPAGMRELITYLVRRRMVDVLVTTGATLYHDAYETIGGKHFLGTDQIDNVMLRRNRIDRVYDVYADENKFYHLDVMIEKEFSLRFQPGKAYSSREVMHEFGKWIAEKKRDRDGICVAAYEMGVPIFVPAGTCPNACEPIATINPIARATKRCLNMILPFPRNGRFRSFLRFDFGSKTARLATAMRQSQPRFGVHLRRPLFQP